MRLLSGFTIIFALLHVVLADVGPPAHVQITESEPELYTVQWRVPKVLIPRAVPSPHLPETCQPSGEVEVLDQPGAWLFTQKWNCETSITGQEVGIRYPFPDLALTTVIRVDLLSGDRFAQILSPGDSPWRLPEGTAARDWVREAQQSLLAGVSHALTSWIHLLFLFLLSLMGDYRQPIRLVTAFTVGQVVGILGSTLIRGIGEAPAELGLAAGLVVLARQTLEPDCDRRRLWALSLASGLIHGLGLSALMAGNLLVDGAGLFAYLFAIVGVDLAHLTLALGLTWFWLRMASDTDSARLRRTMVFSTGVLGLTLATALSFSGSTAIDSETPRLELPTRSEEQQGSGVRGSQRLAPSIPNAAVQSFVAVEPFEIRHEVMLRLAGLTEELGLEMNSTLKTEDQRALREELVTLVLESTELRVGGQISKSQLRNAYFMTVDQTGALPRPEPVPEPVQQGVVGVVLTYPTSGIPQHLSLIWRRLPIGIASVPTTLIDPENVTVQTISSEERSVRWENRLVEDPIPTITEVAIEPLEFPVPWFAIPLLAAAAALLFSEVKGRRRGAYFAVARILLAVAVLVGPLVQTAVAIPGSAGQTPSSRNARRILSGLLPNIYRAMEFREESLIYDRLSISITGETLTEVYLGQRKVLEVEERGGAQARVETVEVLEADEIQSLETGFGVRSIWTVGGMVTHFGHRHFRQNRYNAWIEIIPVSGTWKIRSIEVLEQERVK